METTAHPRSRGENKCLTTPALALSGSSPLTRGKLRLCCSEAVRVGLIPAHAGKTNSPHVIAQPLAAHPRSRGENHIVSRAGIEPAGSSPLTRGKLTGVPRDTTRFRLIPAHAGKTESQHPPILCHPAHPRSRGENNNKAKASVVKHGSSPLTRGKLLHRRCDL